MQNSFLGDRVGVLRGGEEITVWNELTVTEQHNVTVTGVESYHKILAGDGSSGEEPEYVTPKMNEWLRQLDVYPNVEVVDPMDDEVTVL
jgi:hypothetical protein